MATNPSSQSDDLQIPQSKLTAFLPPDFPRVYEDGRVPLRVQVADDRRVLHTVLTKPKKGIYMCSHCNVRFSSFGPLLDHIDANDIKRPHTCTYDDCPWKIVGFTKQRQLNRHLKSVHLDRNEYQCNVPGCGKFFGRIDLLNRHTKSIHDNKNSRFNLRLEAQRRSSTTSTGSTATSSTTAYIDSPMSSVVGSRITSPDLSRETITIEQSPNIEPTTEQQLSHGQSPSSTSTNATLNLNRREHDPSSGQSQQQQGSEPSNKYKHTIQFLTDNDPN
ncbi:CYFA0S02e04852g1_1 [Cyberlindnera fabianii]|uniref:CYFA0S02e04852g1_1 n=1 Tax=Cyberlindnera fabianii TaxID=36022 RepID=A0A061ANI6_CYBFA|nr:Zinc finger protein RME1 [Cyberlindnera fabianii]CDR38713.1 CYFA0S02e04852g1_1 [Cyberlindnera fabianii]